MFLRFFSCVKDYQLGISVVPRTQLLRFKWWLQIYSPPGNTRSTFKRPVGVILCDPQCKNGKNILKPLKTCISSIKYAYSPYKHQHFLDYFQYTIVPYEIQIFFIKFKFFSVLKYKCFQF